MLFDQDERPVSVVPETMAPRISLAECSILTRDILLVYSIEEVSRKWRYSRSGAHEEDTAYGYKNPALPMRNRIEFTIGSQIKVKLATNLKKVLGLELYILALTNT